MGCTGLWMEWIAVQSFRRGSISQLNLWKITFHISTQSSLSFSRKSTHILPQNYLHKVGRAQGIMWSRGTTFMGKITENEEMLSTLQGNLPLRNLQHRP